ncbi:MAG: hypothetical protein H0T86_16260 [Gemmatimonadales bacterium]|nr:hypothetical protein [Gemmatimonadales bacterium]
MFHIIGMPRKSPYARVSITLPREVLAAAGAAEVAAARRQHLLADLQLAPEERLRRAAALLHLAPGAGTRRRAQIIGFDSYEDFATWKKARRVEGLRRS